MNPLRAFVILAVGGRLAGCSTSSTVDYPIVSAPPSESAAPADVENPLPGMPPVTDPRKLYAGAGKVIRNVHMGPQDIKLAPDGGAHGLYLSRDATRLYVTNRHEGTISVLNADTGAEITKWHLPGNASPDMGNLTADGTQLWLSGRYNSAVHVLSTADGTLLHTIPVGAEPHGLCVWPQPAATPSATPASPADTPRTSLFGRLIDQVIAGHWQMVTERIFPFDVIN